MNEKSSDRPRFILDTNVLVHFGFNYRNPTFHTLLGESRAGTLELIIPEVVLLEYVNQYREKVAHHLDMLAAASNELEDLDITSPRAPNVSASTAADNFEQQLRKTLAQHNVTIAPLPSVGHEVVLMRAIAKQRPFHGQDAGYRDTLIWLTILDLLPGAPIQLASFDKVFQEAPNSPDLALSLVAELAARSFRADHVQLLSRPPDLATTVKSRLTSAEATARTLAARLAVDAQFTAALVELVTTSIQHVPLERHPTGVPDVAEDITLAYIEALEVEDVEAAHEVSEGTVLIDIAVRADADIEYVVYRADAYTLSDAAFATLGPWSDRYMSGSQGVSLHLGLTVLYEPNARELKGVQLDRVTDDNGVDLFQPTL